MPNGCNRIVTFPWLLRYLILPPRFFVIVSYVSSSVAFWAVMFKVSSSICCLHDPSSFKTVITDYIHRYITSSSISFIAVAAVVEIVELLLLLLLLLWVLL